MKLPNPININNGKFNSPHWNGQPCLAEIGSVVLAEKFPSTYWCNGLQGKRIPCIKITAANNPAGNLNAGSETFYILLDADGFNKVFFEGGGPFSGHASITVDDESTFIPTPVNV